MQLFLNYRHCNFVSFLRLIKQKTSRCDTGDEPPTINLESNSQSSHLWLLIMAFAWHDCDETVRGRFITRNLFCYNWRINSSFLARTRSKIDHKFRLQRYNLKSANFFKRHGRFQYRTHSAETTTTPPTIVCCVWPINWYSTVCPLGLISGSWATSCLHVYARLFSKKKKNSNFIFDGIFRFSFLLFF